MDKQTEETGRTNEGIESEKEPLEMAGGEAEVTMPIANEADDIKPTAETTKTTRWKFNVSGWIKTDSRLKPSHGKNGNICGFSPEGGESDSDIVEYSPAFGIFSMNAGAFFCKESEMGKIGVELIDYDDSGCTLEQEDDDEQEGSKTKS